MNHDAIREKAASLLVGSCSCGIKSPDIQFHKEICRYRVSYELIESQRKLLAEAASNKGRRDTLIAAMERLGYSPHGLVLMSLNSMKFPHPEQASPGENLTVTSQEK